MKTLLKLTNGKKIRVILIGLAVSCLVFALSAITDTSSASAEKGKRLKNGQPAAAAVDPNLPPQIDVRGGTPRGLDILQPTVIQQRALSSLKNTLGITDLHVRYNGLTATPMSINNPAGYLSAPSSGDPQQIARDFLSQWRSIYRFDDNNLSNLKLVSRAVTQEGTTVMLFQQQANNLPVYHGEVLVNVSKTGQIINVGGDSFPQLNITNGAAISPAAAVQTAAADMGINGFTPVSLGAAKILSTYGNLTPEYVDGEKFDHNVLTDDVVVQQIVFPLGDTGRIAYKFNLVTPQYKSIMWQVIVDAQTGAILRRISLTSSQTGGGNSIPRLGTFRPDVQNMVENHGDPGGAKGRVFDTMPVTMSGVPLSTDATGANSTRAVRTGTYPNYMITRPNYNAEATLANHFRYSLYAARNEDPLPFTLTSLSQPLTPTLFGQVTRNFPDALHPSASSPLGWFYLPTDNNGQMITTATNDHGTTQTIGYTMAPEAQTRNLAVNSPNGNGAQPFSADLTALGSTKSLADGRSFSSVYQSRYTEGNNVAVSDDHANDNDGTKGIKGYSANRQYNAGYYDYYGEYEFGGVDASGGGTGSTTPVTYPNSANPDVYPDTVSLFNLNNVEHDYLYSIGFTEQFWNFQFDNFGKGGAGNDGIIAEVQDGSGTDNANMSTPAEGTSPRMQMYLFTDGGFRRSDGDLDWDVVAHEHYHGVSNRSAAKGGDSCLGTPLVGESGGMGEGWSDTIASSMSDDEGEGEYVTGEGDVAIRRLPYTNYRWSYGSINGRTLNVRPLGNPVVPTVPDNNALGIPYEVHDIGEVWAATLWDMRELMIMKDPNGVFFDGSRRLGSGSTFYIGSRAVQSVDANHPIDYRASFNDSVATVGTNPVRANIVAANHIVRPGLIAAENASNPARNGPLATAVSNGARLADKVVLRGLQLAPCNPTFVDMRDSMLAADREISGGENQAIMWRSFASHGVGTNATSTGKTNGVGQQGAAAAIVEDFTVPQGVTDCETLGPLPAPGFTLANSANNSVTVTIAPVTGAANYVIARGTSANGPFTTIATITGTSYTDNDNGAGLILNQTYYYQVHAARSAYCVGLASINSVTITLGAALSPAPIFAGLGKVDDPKSGDTLTLSWSPATSLNVGANIVYDIYRVINVTPDTDLTAPTFTPGAANRIAQGVTATVYNDPNLTLGQQYYYIVQARDTTNSKIDTNNAGNTVTRLNAPSSNKISGYPFALETFDNTATANSRFTPALTESGTTPDRGTAMFQRVTTDLGGPVTSVTAETDAASAVTGAMYAPDFDPGNAGQGGPSDFYTTIAPTGLTRKSFLEFDHKFNTEATFDGGNIEILLGASTLPVTPSPNNTTTFDLNDYIVQNSYNGNLNGTLEGAAMGSALQGRRAFTGSKPLNHVKVAIGDFAPGGVKNPNSLPVYIRFHSTSDAGSFVDGWFIDNLVVSNYDSPSGLEADVASRPNGDGSILSDDVVQVRRFLNGTDTPDANTNEFQRADSAPSSTRGDGLIQSDDVVQTRRYQNTTDAVQSAGGPTTQLTNFAAASAKKGKSAKAAKPSAAEAAREVRIQSTTGNAGRQVTVNVQVDATGDEAEYGFVVNYDQTKLSGPVVGAGNAGAGTRSCNIGTAGKVNCSVGSFPNNNPSSSDSGIGEIGAGSNQILMTVTFNVAPNAPAGTTPVTITGLNASNDAAQQLTVTPTNGTVTLTAAARKLRAENASTSAGSQVTVNIRVDAAGDEAEYGFVVNYDQTILSNPVIGAGNAGAGTRSCNIGTAGKVNCSVGSFPNNNPSSSDSGIGEIAGADNQILITIIFNVASNAQPGSTALTLSNVNTSNDAAQSVAITPTSGTVTIAGATAASTSVSGRAVSSKGDGIGNVLITMKATDGSVRTVRTNQFGYYSFSDVLSGRSYVFSASDKRYTFTQPSQVVNLNDDGTTVNFTAKQDRRL